MLNPPRNPPICVNGLHEVSTTRNGGQIDASKVQLKGFSANRRHPLKRTDDLLVISDRDQLAEAVYTAAVETGAVVGAI